MHNKDKEGLNEDQVNAASSSAAHSAPRALPAAVSYYSESSVLIHQVSEPANRRAASEASTPEGGMAQPSPF